MKRLIVLFFILFNLNTNAQEQPQEARPSAGSDFLTSMKWLVQGSYKQFNKNNLYTLGVAVPATWYAFNQDDYVFNSTQGKSVSDTVQFVSDASVFFATPVLQAGLYFIGRGNENSKMMQYAMEMFSTTYLAFSETFLLSYIDVHERPDNESLDDLENLRGPSSFTSGHMIAYT